MNAARDARAAAARAAAVVGRSAGAATSIGGGARRRAKSRESEKKKRGAGAADLRFLGVPRRSLGAFVCALQRTHGRCVHQGQPPPPCDARPSRQRALMWRPRGESWRDWGPPSIGRPLPLSFLSRARVTLLNARLWCALGEPASLALHPRVRKGGEKAGSEGAEEGRRARRRPVPSPGCPRPLCTRPAPGQGPTSLRGARVQ